MSRKLSSQPEAKQRRIQDFLAVGVVTLSVVAVSVLSAVAIQQSNDEERARTTQTVLVAVLPLLGSWVGTVLAYYFSRENLEAATRSVSELSRQLTEREKLEAILVKDKMIKKSEIFFKTLPNSELYLTQLLNELENFGKGLRIPILTTKSHPSLMLHRSAIDKYLVAKARSAPPVANLDSLTVENLLEDDSELKLLAETSFGVIREGATLAEAKDIMDNTPFCQDVFITTSGAKADAVIGWITDKIIRDNAIL